MSEKQLLEYQDSLKIFRDNINIIKTAEIEGFNKGKIEGIKEGIKEGIREGIRLTVLNLLKAGVGIDIISSSTGLTHEEIDKIKQEL